MDMTKEQARTIANDIVNHLLELDLIRSGSSLDVQAQWAEDTITERLLINQ